MDWYRDIWTVGGVLIGLGFVICLTAWAGPGYTHRWKIALRVILFALAVTVLGPLLLWISYGFAELFLFVIPVTWDNFEKKNVVLMRPVLLGGFMLIAAVVVHAAGGAARDYLNRSYDKSKN